MTIGELLEGLRAFASDLRDNPNYETIRQAADDLHRLVDAVLPPAPEKPVAADGNTTAAEPASGTNELPAEEQPPAPSVPDPTRQSEDEPEPVEGSEQA